MSAAREVVIVGAGKLGGLLLDCLDGDEHWNCTAFHDDAKAGQEYRGLPILNTDPDQLRPGQAAFIAVGYPGPRRAVIERLQSRRLDWQTYIDRRAMVGGSASIGTGSIVLSFCMIGSTVSIGSFCYCSAYAHIGTGSSIGAFTSVLAGASVGESSVGEDCVIGMKSICLDGAVLGRSVSVAPFTLVRRRVPDDALIAGSPARILRRRSALR